MFKSTVTVAVLSAIALGGDAKASTQLSYENAVEVCTQRAIKFGQQPSNRFADEPPPSMVQDQYRACVYAYSRQYPTEKVKYRETFFSLQRVFE